MNVDTENILSSLRGAMPSAKVMLLHNPGPSGQHSLRVDCDDLVEVCCYLRDYLSFDLLSNVTGVDWPDPSAADLIAIPEDETPQSEVGFLEVVYHLYSTTQRVGPLVLRARTEDRLDQIRIPSLVSIYRSAEFQEREIYDLYGIEFVNHPDLRRILMWDEFVDHPMRKDYIAPDDYEYEPTPHDKVLEKAKAHYPAVGGECDSPLETKHE
jgi:NADH-quinone oxidoreductase subunit C